MGCGFAQHSLRATRLPKKRWRTHHAKYSPEFSSTLLHKGWSVRNASFGPFGMHIEIRFPAHSECAENIPCFGTLVCGNFGFFAHSEWAANSRSEWTKSDFCAFRTDRPFFIRLGIFVPTAEQNILVVRPSSRLRTPRDLLCESLVSRARRRGDLERFNCVASFPDLPR